MSNFQFAGKDVVRLAKKLGTPFFLFDEARIEENYKNLWNSFSSKYKNLRIDYSAKTNLEFGILKILKNLGAHLEISAPHELEVAKRAGFLPSRVILDTPVKREEEISKLLLENIHAFYADSFDDVKWIQKVAKEKSKYANVVLRVNPGFPLAILNLAERFLEKFGIKEEDVLEVSDFIKAKCPNLNLIGLSVHVGSQQLTPAHHLRALKKLFKLTYQLEEKSFKISELCVGGGYPSPSLNKKTLLSLGLSFFGMNLETEAVPVAEFGRRISEAFAKEVKSLSSYPQLVIQPGRSIVSDAGIAIGRVMVVKGKWIFLDLSTSSLPESLFFGQRKIILANKYKQKLTGKFNVAGRGLNTADNLAISAPLPSPTVGDIAVIFDAGAYTISRANRFTILNPPIYLVDKKGQIRRIRRGETYEDILAPMEA